MKILLFVSAHCLHCPKAERNVKRIVPIYSIYGVTFSKIRMQSAEGKELAAKHYVMATPTIIILDNNGNEQQRIVGVPSEDLIKRTIERLLGLRKSFLSRIFGK